MSRSFVLFALLALVTIVPGCDRDDSTRVPLRLSTDPVVFDDEFDEVIFEPFANAYLTAVRVAKQETFGGSAGAVRIDVQPLSKGPYSGGAFTAFVARDLSGYNVLRMKIKANKPATLDLIGIGEGNTGASIYQASMTNIALTTEWRELLVPVPRPSRLRAERGMMYFADTVGGSDPAAGYTIYIDEIEWASVGGVRVISAQVPNGATEAILGQQIVFEPDGRLPRVQMDVQGTTRSMTCRSWYFDYYDAADTTGAPVITFDRGAARVVGGGTADIRARLGSLDAAGALRITAIAPPAENSPTPSLPASDVLSLFSDPYEDSGIDNFRPQFGAGTFYRLGRPGNEVLAYTGFTFEQEIIIDFATQLVDATSYTHFRVDAWLPAGREGGTTNPLIAVRLNDFGADAAFSGDPFPQGDDSTGAIGIGVTGAPLASGRWITFEIPLEDFGSATPSSGIQLASRLRDRAHIAGVGIKDNGGYIFLDNLLFYRASNGD